MADRLAQAVEGLEPEGTDRLAGAVGETEATEREQLRTSVMMEEILLEPDDARDPLRQGQIAAELLESFDEPANLQRDAENRVMLSTIFNLPLEDVMFMDKAMLKYMFNDELVSLADRFRKRPVEGGFFAKLGEAAIRGNENVSSDIAVYEAVFEGRGDPQQIIDIRNKRELEQLLTPIEGNLISDLFYKSAQIVPGMARGYWDAIPEATAGMLIGAAIPAIGGQAGPQVALPEEVITVPVGAAIGLRAGLLAGSAQFWYKQGAGAAVAEMLDNGYDPEISRTVAGIAGLPYALIEASQVSALTPGLRKAITSSVNKTVLTVMGKAVKKYGKTLTTEVLQEIQQEIILISAEDVSGILSDADIKLDADYIASRSGRIWETAKESTKAMALLPVPGVGIDVNTGVKQVLSAKKQAEINAKLDTELRRRFNALVIPTEAEVPVDTTLAGLQAQSEAEAKLAAGTPLSEAERTQFPQIAEQETQIAKLAETAPPEEAAPAPEQPQIDKPAPDVQPEGVEEAKAVDNVALLRERQEIKKTPPKQRTPQQIERLDEVETTLVEENADEFPEIDITPKARNAEIKKAADQIKESGVYQAEIEGIENLPDLAGTFNVDSQEIGDVRQRFEGRPDILKKFKLVEAGGARWDQSASEIGIDKLDEFMDAVELFVDSEKETAGINDLALARTLDSKKPEVLLPALKHDMLKNGFTAAEVNDAIREFAVDQRIDLSLLEDEFISLKDITDVEKKQAILKELDRTIRKDTKKKAIDPEQAAIAKARLRANKDNIPIFITERVGIFKTSINQPQGDFIVVTPAPSGQVRGKVERVTQGKEGLTRTEIKAAGPEAAAELIKAQAKGEDVGFKAGERASREKAKVAIQKLKAAQKLTEARRKTAVELVKAFVDKENQGVFLKRVSEAKTPRDLEKLTEAVEKGIERAEKQEAIAALNKAVKAIKPKQMLPEFAEMAQNIIDSLKLGQLKEDTAVQNAEIKEMAQQILDQSRPDSVAAFQAEALLKELRAKTAKTFAVNKLSTEAIEQITDTLTALRFQNESDTIAGKGEQAKEAIRRRKLIKEQISKPPKGTIAPFKGFKALHDNLESVTDAVTGARPGTYDLWVRNKKALTEFVYDVLDRGVDDQVVHNKTARNIFRKILADNKVTEKDIIAWSARPQDTSFLKKAFGFGVTPIVHKFKLENFEGKTTEFNFTTNELMSVFMHVRNSHNLAVLLNDGMDRFEDRTKIKIRGFTIEIIDDMVDALTDQQKNVARQVGKQLMDGFNRDAINNVSTQLEFLELARVENYWPANRSIIRTLRGESLRGAISLIESMGLLKERVGIGNPMRLSGFFETVYASNKNVSSYVGLAKPLREVKAVLGTDVIETMEDKGRGDEAQQIKKFIERFEDQATVISPLDTLVKRMLAGFAKSKLFLNVKIAPRQQISEFLISAYVDPKYMAAFRGVATKKLIAEITEISPQLGSARFEGLQFDRDIGDSFQQNAMMNYLTGSTTLVDKAAFGLRYFDTNAIVDIYRAAKAEVLDKNPGIDLESAEGKALLKDRFEWVVRHTQPMWQVKDRSLLGSDPRPLVRAITMFMSQREQLIRMSTNAASDWANSEKTAEDAVRVGRGVGAVAMNMAAFTVFNFAYAILIQRKKKEVKDLGNDFLKDMLSLPFFGKYLSKSFDVTFNALGDKPLFFNREFDPGAVESILAEILLSAIPNFALAGKHFFTGEKYQGSSPRRGELKWTNELLVATDSLIDGLASLKGLPYYGAKDIVKSVKAQIPKE